MSSSPDVLLIGGSGLGPWAWEHMVADLEREGLTVHTPQLRATGGDRTPATEITLADWIEDVASYITSRGLTEPMIVAHSFAGYVAAGLLEHRPGLVGTAVFLDAALPAPGKSWFDMAGASTERFMTGLATDGAIPWYTKEQLDTVYPEHGITREDYEWMRVRVTPQPVDTYRQSAISRPIDTEANRLVYIRCLRTTPPAADIAPDAVGWTHRTIDTGHWPMITAPRPTATAIAECIHG